MVVVNEESLEKLKDLSFKPQYNIDTGELNEYVLRNIILVEKIKNPYNDIAAPVWKIYVSKYAETETVVNTLFDMFKLGICKKIESESDLLERP